MMTGTGKRSCLSQPCLKALRRPALIAPNSQASGSIGAVRQVSRGNHQSDARCKPGPAAPAGGGYLPAAAWVVKVTCPSPAICAACIT